MSPPAARIRPRRKNFRSPWNEITGQWNDGESDKERKLSDKERREVARLSKECATARDRSRRAARWGRSATPFARLGSLSLLHSQRRVVNHERRLQTVVFLPKETDLNGLPLEAADIERMLLITSRCVQVGEGPQSRQHGVGRIEHLNLERIVRRGGSRFRRVDMQPEAQGRRGDGGRNGDRLSCRVGMGPAVTVQPGIPRTAVRRLGR